MRTRTCVLFSIFLLISAVIFISASCDSGAVDNNNTVEYGYFMYDGTRYSVNKGFLEGSQLVDDTFVNFDFIGCTPGVNYLGAGQWTGAGDVMVLELFSPTDPPAHGIYTFVTGESDPNWRNPYTFCGSNSFILINVNFEAVTADVFLHPESGTVTVTLSGSNMISLGFDVILEDGKAVTGYWSGPVDVSFDHY